MARFPVMLRKGAGKSAGKAAGRASDASASKDSPQADQTADAAEGSGANGGIGTLSPGKSGTGKGAPSTDGKRSASDGDVAECPNCGCEFDDDTGKVLKKGLPVVGKPGEPDENEGADLDAYMSAPPESMPTHYGRAYDASAGSRALGMGLPALVTNALKGAK